MKKYLKDLETELKKLNVSDEEIAEILADHKEMLEEAQSEGVTDEEMISKFGDPKNIARDLYEDVLDEDLSQKEEPVFGTESLQGYELMKSIQVLEGLNAVNINLVSEDIIFFPYEGETIEVYVRGKFNEEEYTINFKDGIFNLIKSKGKVSFNIFGKKTPDFGVRFPQCHLENFKLSLVSGDGNIEDINADGVTFKTVSGDLKVSNITSTTKVEVSVVSGDVKLNSLSSAKLEMSSVSGDVSLKKVKLEEQAFMSTVSGDINADTVKVPEIEFRTVSGDFNGKEVYCDVVSLKSLSGDFTIENSNKDHKIEVTSKSSLSGKVTIK
jgi:hypothetical protein